MLSPMKQPLSTQDMAHLNVERALDALARGEAVCLTEGGSRLMFQAAEAMQEVAAKRAVISNERAAYLGILPAVTFGAGESTRLGELLYAKKLTAPVESTSASPLEIMAAGLVKRAGFLPIAALDGEEANALELSVDAVRAFHAAPPALKLQTEITMPTEAAENTRVAVFSERGVTHLALMVGTPEKEAAPLARVHSSCLTGDLLGSLRCDCGGQLKAALEAIANEGCGVLLYLNQEGRGIGLLSKLRAYKLQEEGLDTVEANLALGYGEDERDFTVAASMLKALNINAIRLMTNNPEKMTVLTAAGIRITERVPLVVASGAHNKHYLATKASKLGHTY
jgi:GTP cyclohydrolase II